MIVEKEINESIYFSPESDIDKEIMIKLILNLIAKEELC